MSNYTYLIICTIILVSLFIDYSYMNICIYTISIIGNWKEDNLFTHV